MEYIGFEASSQPQPDSGVRTQNRSIWQSSMLTTRPSYSYILQSWMLPSIRGISKTRAVPRKIFRFRLYCSVFSASFSIRGIQNFIFFRVGFEKHTLSCRRSYLSNLIDFGFWLVIVDG